MTELVMSDEPSTLAKLFYRICFCFKPKPKVEEKERILKPNDRVYNEKLKYADNYIKTSKYSLITFFPKNLFEQFRRLTNTYFLVLMVLQFIPQISSLSPWTTILPLIAVLLVTGVKDAVDDIHRHSSDNDVNNRISFVVRNGRLEEQKWMDVKVGDIVKLPNNHFVAADLLLLSSSEPNGLCYIETTDLDGETNLKARQALTETAELGESLVKLTKFKAQVICEPPNNRISEFNGRIVIDNKTLPIGNDQVILRGCRLRNTKWCFGMVIFAGRDTKLMMNSGKTIFKRTSLDAFLNKLIIGIVFFLIALCTILAIFCGFWEFHTGRPFTIYLPWDPTVISDVTAMGERSDREILRDSAIISTLTFFSYIMLLNTLVPISLYVSVEIIRVLHSWFINWDEQMYYEKKDIVSKARTTTLNEELGQVEYIFSDKTGTLTQNIMTFNKCSIDGKLYGDLTEEQAQQGDNLKSLDFSSNKWYEPQFQFFDAQLQEESRGSNEKVSEFWRLLALCHTVMPDRSGGQLLYQAQSPDEAALTSAARNFGFVFKSRTPKSITIEVNGKEELYDLLCILDFDNVRKRMSVIVRTMTGEIKLYCKGADSMIMARLSKESDALKKITAEHLDKFANGGLRTLCVSYKVIDPTFFADWSQRYRAATVATENRDEQVDKLSEEIETEMLLLGATAIEDKLQDGVPDTIANLAAANIKIWVLTGDKQDTAINIGYSCKLLTTNMKEIFIVDGDEESEVADQLNDIKIRMADILSGKPVSTPRGSTTNLLEVPTKNSDAVKIDGVKGGPDDNGDDDAVKDGGFALVINGNSLVFALLPAHELLLCEIGCACVAVICCRVTPLQKAMVVDLVKRNKKAVSLAVGDGANDVSMIKTAHIGVGIAGPEGMQAVLASDYSIGQFRFLERLLLVHGRWSYFRMAKFLRYFFYKNFAFTLVHFWYAFFCGYSARTIFDPLLIACYNLFFTSLPVLVMGIFDQDVDEENCIRWPQLYKPGQENAFFNIRLFFRSVMHGIIASMVIFFVPYASLMLATNHAGLDMNDFATLAFTAFSALIVAATAQIVLDTSYWTVYNHIVIWGSLAIYFVLATIHYEVIPVWSDSKTNSSHIVFRAILTPKYWLNLLLSTVILIVPVMTSRSMALDARPAQVEALRRAQIRAPKKTLPEQALLRPLSREPDFPTRPLRYRPRYRKGALRSGYAFSHQTGWGRLITEGKFWNDIDALNLEYPSASNAAGQSQAPYHLLQLEKDMPAASLAAMHKLSLPPNLEAFSQLPVTSADITPTTSSKPKPPLATVESFGLDETESLLDSKK